MTGGENGGTKIATTELLREGSSAWEYGGELPSARSGLRAATLYNKLIVTGKAEAIKITKTYLY